MQWPAHEALLAYIERVMKPEALAAYRQTLDWYVNGKLEKKPSLPAILRDG